MSKRLLKSTYFHEEQELLFASGMPVGWKATTTGTSSYAARDYTDAYGSNFFAAPSGAVGSGVSLEGFNISSAKIVEMEIQDLQIIGDIQAVIGLSNADDTSFAVMNVLNGGLDKGQVNVMHQNVNSAGRSITALHNKNSDLVVNKTDLKIVIDFEKGESYGYFEYSKGAKVATNFPSGKILIPKVRALQLGTSTPALRFRKMNIDIYS